MNFPSIRLRYRAPGDTAGLVIVEFAKAVGVLAGVAILPFGERFGWFWALQLGAGLLSIIAGFIYIIRQVQRRRAAATTGGGSQQPNDPEMQVDTEPDVALSISVLPLQTILIGVFIVAPALIGLILKRSQDAHANWIAMYFSAPAILLWMTGEGFYIFPYINARPKHLTQFAGIAKSGLLVLGALMLWIYLGLTVGAVPAVWMYIASILLAIIGVSLGIVAENIRGNTPQAA